MNAVNYLEQPCAEGNKSLWHSIWHELTFFRVPSMARNGLQNRLHFDSWPLLRGSHSEPNAPVTS